MDKLRVGFIGAGGMADAHLKGLVTDRFADVQIAAFCDVVLERAQAQAAKYSQHGPEAFSDPREMIRSAGLDACYILLPPFAHGDAERACLEGNVPFLVEKPIGKDLGVLREIRDEVQRKNLLTAVGYMNRYQPGVQQAKKAFEDSEPVLAYGGWLSGPPTAPKDGSAGSLIGQWWVVKEKSGGQFVEQVSHTVDLVRYFLGDAVEVFACATTAFNKKVPDLRPGYTIDDALTTCIKFKNGAIANIMASAATPVGGGITLNVLGTSSAVRFTGWGHDATIMRRVDGKTTEEKAASEPDIFPVEDRTFLDAVRSGDRSRIGTDYADGFKTAQLAVGANESAATGRAVDLTQ
ncbi:MAG: Gfo/Idh/MocA family oxidoreductase [Chloroflexi bacterium]|nr:Gfo/Idh/MocA family oxidoreductase [Chloroflexota bacterium]